MVYSPLHLIRALIAVFVLSGFAQGATVSFKVEKDEDGRIREVVSFVMDQPVPYIVRDYTIIQQVLVEIPGFDVDMPEIIFSSVNSTLVEKVTSYRGNLIIHLRHVPVTISDRFDNDPFVIQVILDADRRRISQVQANVAQLLQSLAQEMQITPETPVLTGPVSPQSPMGPGLTEEDLYQLELRSSAIGMLDPYRSDRQLRELNTPDAIALRQAYSYFGEGNDLQALDELLYIIREHPESPLVEEATFLLGDAYHNIPQEPPGVQFRDAITVYEKAIDLYPGSRFVPRAIYGIGQSYEALGNPAAAKFHYEMIPSPIVNEYIGPALLAVARLELEQDSVRGAIEAMETLLQYDEDHWRMEALRQLTRLEFKADHYQRSADYFTRLQNEYSELFTFDPQLLLEAAQSYHQVGELRKAAWNLQRVINVYPHFDGAAKAFLELATIHHTVGNTDLAQMFISELTGKYPDTLDASRGQLLHARILMEKDLCEDAMGLYSLVEFGIHSAELEKEVILGKIDGEICLANYEVAESMARSFLRSFPLADEAEEVRSKQHRAVYLRALFEHEEGNFRVSYDLLRTYLNNQPLLPNDEENHAAIVELAQENFVIIGLAMMDEDPYRALEHLKRYAGLYNGEARHEEVERHIRDLQHRLAHKEIDGLQFQRAISRLNEAVQNYETGYRSADFRDLRVYALFKQGEFFFNNGNYEDGSTYFDRIFSEFSETPYAAMSQRFLVAAGKGNVLQAFNASNYVEAIDQFHVYEKYLAMSAEEYFEAAKLASLAYTRLSFHDRGLEHINDMEQVLPAAYSEKLDDLRALNYWGLQQYERVVRALEPRMERDEPLMVEAYEALANAFSRLNRSDRAVETFLKAAELLSDDDPAQSRRMRFEGAQLLRSLGRDDEARQQYQDIVDNYEINPTLDPVVVDAYQQLVSMAAAQSDHETVIGLSESALQLLNGHEEASSERILYFMEQQAIAYQRTNRVAQAITIYESIYERSPESVTGLRAKQELDSYEWNRRMREQLR
ncbi:Tetratricopeptide TPR_1 repeat-containing protein [Desulfurispirillum indicum S5]|uniref:Tetratricopeptide TPR_1 repeat-containing protein n=1 Tax=Desulfurispirillum indicum (strain ATCC BAA-1389 / DSM 22839 / S5) TaxID=653733 RepID=E6W6J5_DESIS|nr:tetratricopeptide repeat protein [Desulfurispirillum indicum]ADU67330.1 Tetratricopeptide TPR_1 repeat-containing protein [Desulfurispirillum indicum S5]